MLEQLFLFIVFIIPIIATPGPGIILTISNSVNTNYKQTFIGFLGIALSMFFISVVIVLAISSLNEFFLYIMKLFSGIYLFYLAYKTYNSPVSKVANNKKYFFEGFLIGITNPKAYIFFLALFPIFITDNLIFSLSLSFVFFFFVLIIHSVYFLIFNKLKKMSFNNFNNLNKFNKFVSLIYVAYAIYILYATI